jgi:hypothetical protein
MTAGDLQEVFCDIIRARGYAMDELRLDKNPRKTKRQRFLTVAERRTVKVLRALKLLGNCGNKSAYEYNDADIEKIFGAIQDELGRTRDRFGRSKEVHFSLGENEGGAKVGEDS